MVAVVRRRLAGVHPHAVLRAEGAEVHPHLNLEEGVCLLAGRGAGVPPRPGMQGEDRPHPVLRTGEAGDPPHPGLQGGDRPHPVLKTGEAGAPPHPGIQGGARRRPALVAGAHPLSSLGTGVLLHRAMGAETRPQRATGEGARPPPCGGHLLLEGAIRKQK